MKHESKHELGPAYVYVPKGAKLNIENKKSPAPTVEYEKRRANLDARATKNLCGGRYGQS